MRTDADRIREEREIDRVHSQMSYVKARIKAEHTLRTRYAADIGGGDSYPLITWSGRVSPHIVAPLSLWDAD